MLFQIQGTLQFHHLSVLKKPFVQRAIDESMEGPGGLFASYLAPQGQGDSGHLTEGRGFNGAQGTLMLGTNLWHSGPGRHSNNLSSRIKILILVEALQLYV